MIITVQLTNLDDNKGEYALEDFVVKREFERKGITQEDIENESDEFIDAIGILDLEWIDVSDSIDEDEFYNTIKICNGEITDDNIDSFRLLISIFGEMDCEFLDEDFNHLGCDPNLFIDLIKEKNELTNRLGVSWIYYTN
jgi:hypothetical protein